MIHFNIIVVDTETRLSISRRRKKMIRSIYFNVN